MIPFPLLNNLFIDKTINYTYKEYIEHLKLTNEYAKNNKNYNVLTEEDKTFKNITITILKIIILYFVIRIYIFVLFLDIYDDLLLI